MRPAGDMLLCVPIKRFIKNAILFIISHLFSPTSTTNSNFPAYAELRQQQQQQPTYTNLEPSCSTPTSSSTTTAAATVQTTAAMRYTTAPPPLQRGIPSVSQGLPYPGGEYTSTGRVHLQQPYDDNVTVRLVRPVIPVGHSASPPGISIHTHLWFQSTGAGSTVDTSSEYSYGGQQEVKYSQAMSARSAYQYQEQSPFPDWSQAYQAPPVPVSQPHQDSWHQPEFSHVTSTTLGGMHHHPAFLQV